MLTIDGGPEPRPGGSRKSDVAERVRTVVLNTFPFAGLPPLLMDTRLVGTSLGLDSIDAIELVLALEGEFGVAIDESDLSLHDFDTLRTIALLVERNLDHGDPGG